MPIILYCLRFLQRNSKSKFNSPISYGSSVDQFYILYHYVCYTVLSVNDHQPTDSIHRPPAPNSTDTKTDAGLGQNQISNPIRATASSTQAGFYLWSNRNILIKSHHGGKLMISFSKLLTYFFSHRLY